METVHELKIKPEFYWRIMNGQKTFEIRKNDRDFRVGDILSLKEFDGQKYLDYSTPIKAKIVYMTSFAQHDGYVVLGITVIPQENS